MDLTTMRSRPIDVGDCSDCVSVDSPWRSRRGRLNCHRPVSSDVGNAPVEVDRGRIRGISHVPRLPVLEPRRTSNEIPADSTLRSRALLATWSGPEVRASPPSGLAPWTHGEPSRPWRICHNSLRTAPEISLWFVLAAVLLAACGTPPAASTMPNTNSRDGLPDVSPKFTYQVTDPALSRECSISEAQ